MSAWQWSLLELFVLVLPQSSGGDIGRSSAVLCSLPQIQCSEGKQKFSHLKYHRVLSVSVPGTFGINRPQGPQLSATLPKIRECLKKKKKKEKIRRTQSQVENNAALIFSFAFDSSAFGRRRSCSIRLALPGIAVSRSVISLALSMLFLSRRHRPYKEPLVIGILNWAVVFAFLFEWTVTFRN